MTNAQGCKREESGRAIEGRDKERCKLTRLARLAATEATTSTDTACVCVCGGQSGGCQASKAGQKWIERRVAGNSARAVVNGERVGDDGSGLCLLVSSREDRAAADGWWSRQRRVLYRSGRLYKIR